MSEKLWRNGIDQLEVYVPGKAIEDVKKEFKLDEVLRLASNENPYGPSPKAIEAMQKAIFESHLYPESTCRELREKLGNLHGFDSDQYVMGNGADNIITLIGSAYINPGDEIVSCMPTFSEYRKIAQLMGGIPVEVPTTNSFVFDLEALLEAVNDKTKLVYICNPNNPTGTIIEEEIFISFLQRLPKHVLVILDEAYAEFIEVEGYRTGLDYIREGYPVISIRTFSKMYGLAGARIGYAVAKKEHIIPVQAVREPFAANRIILAGALAVLDDEEYKIMVIQENRREKERLVTEFQSFGYDVIESHTNFLFINMKQDTSSVFQALMRKGIIIRPCAQWGFPTYARITMGTREQNEKLLKALREVCCHTVQNETGVRE